MRIPFGSASSHTNICLGFASAQPSMLFISNLLL
uniref:Uncharacterized protein n=1 Tax=Siphoviridae sp. ctk5O4 TaxID=2827921 RepID=A0A8S5SK87_9CAUD|nr:MAG TPA: hypothetical protein [Siphoviridae sp. ctk5O4]